MKWMRPEFVEIDMSAEIGGYQRDNDGPTEGPAQGPRVPVAFAAAATSASPASAEA
jgi:hypothetical protein